MTNQILPKNISDFYDIVRFIIIVIWLKLVKFQNFFLRCFARVYICWLILGSPKDSQENKKAFGK